MYAASGPLSSIWSHMLHFSVFDAIRHKFIAIVSERQFRWLRIPFTNSGRSRYLAHFALKHSWTLQKHRLHLFLITFMVRMNWLCHPLKLSLILPKVRIPLALIHSLSLFYQYPHALTRFILHVAKRLLFAVGLSSFPDLRELPIDFTGKLPGNAEDSTAKAVLESYSSKSRVDLASGSCSDSSSH